MKKLVAYKKTNRRFYRPQPIRKVPIHSLAAVFKTYNDALSQADLLFEVFSPERLEAQRVALVKLNSRLSAFGITNIDWTDSANYVVKYANPQGAIAA